ncbi:MAG: hypothetical protein ABSD38_31050, partial [Syntrophorhabdales bacterium]
SALFHSSFRVGSIVGKQLILLRKEDSCEGLIESNRIFRVNRIDSGSQYTKEVEGCVFDGADGSQMAFWTAYGDRSSARTLTRLRRIP